MEGESPIMPVMVVANFRKSLLLTPCLLKVSQNVSMLYLLIEYSFNNMMKHTLIFVNKEVFIVLIRKAYADFSSGIII
jgi:hypothetical protein